MKGYSIPLSISPRFSCSISAVEEDGVRDMFSLLCLNEMVKMGQDLFRIRVCILNYLRSRVLFYFFSILGPFPNNLTLQEKTLIIPGLISIKP